MEFKVGNKVRFIKEVDKLLVDKYKWLPKNTKNFLMDVSPFCYEDWRNKVYTISKIVENRFSDETIVLGNSISVFSKEFFVLADKQMEFEF